MRAIARSPAGAETRGEEQRDGGNGAGKKKIWIGGAGKGIFFVDRTYQARWNNATMQIIEFFFFFFPRRQKDVGRLPQRKGRKQREQ